MRASFRLGLKCKCIQAGSVFIFSITSLVVLLLLGAISVQISMQSLHRAQMQKRNAEAFNLAEAAADQAEAWLRAQSVPPAGTAPLDPFGGSQTLGGGTWSAIIQPSPLNPGLYRKHYIITGTGIDATGTVTKEVIIQVEEQSFALYSYFTNEERSPVTSGTIWFYARDRLYGPVHSNDQFHISWGSTSADPIFYGTVSSSAPSVDWSPRKPQNVNEWRRVLNGGQDALSLGVDVIPMPTTSDAQKHAAWGNVVGFPGTTGVYLPAAGNQVTAGIYIVGESGMEFSVDVPTGNQIITITQGSDVSVITVDLDNNQTILDPAGPSGPTTYTGLPNGVIYSTDNITSLSGTIADNYYEDNKILVRNAWTVATDAENGKDINITDNLVYATQPDSTKPATHPSNLRAPCLGLVGNDIIIASGCPNIMSINAVIFATGSFYYEAYNSIKRNDLRVLGGIIQNMRGPVGMFGSNNVHLKGYNKDYRYDLRMADAPPPFFPTTGQYNILSWQYR